MKPITKLLLILIVVITAVVLLGVLSPPEKIATPPVYEAKTVEGGDVAVTVTPLRLTQGFPASFDVAFETHSVDLAFDVENVATLTDGTNALYKPSWEGSPPGGHHRAGTLRFTPDLTRPTSITLTFTNIAGVPTRVFLWEIK
jgi:hypothetical protein